MSKNTNQAGKGYKQRPRDEKKWQEAPFWKRKEKEEKTKQDKK